MVLYNSKVSKPATSQSMHSQQNRQYLKHSLNLFEMRFESTVRDDSGIALLRLQI